MPSNINFQTGANYAEGSAILSPVIQEIANQTEAQIGLVDEAAKYGFVVGDAMTPTGEITAMVWPEPLMEIDEDGVAPLMTLLQGFTKGYQMKTYGRKHKCTKVFYEWIKKGAHMVGVDSSVANELNKFKEAVERLVAGSTLTLNTQIAKVFANGFSITSAYGAGSPSPDGLPLFSASHVIKKTSGTFSNLIAATKFLTATTLEEAIQNYKTGIYTANNYRIKTPEVFDLLVPRALETTARKILNSNNDQAGIYAGTGSNANLLNVFSFQGSKVRLTVLDMLGEVDEFGAVIGGANANTMWFLLNKEYALKYKAFRVFRLWDNEITMWKDDETDSFFTKLTVHFGVDHYNPEACMWFAWV